MYPEPRHLAPWAPKSSWDGWFAIALFPHGSKIQWLKAHFYRNVRGQGHPLAAVEGFGKTSELMLAWAGSEQQTIIRQEIDATEMTVTQDPLSLRQGDRFVLEGAAPNYRMELNTGAEGPSAVFNVTAGWPVWLARYGRFLFYLGQHSAMEVELNDGGEQKNLAGFGTLEHVCGASLPFNITRLLPCHWHWDLFCFHTPNSPLDSGTGLSLGRNGRTLVRKGAWLRLPGYGTRLMKGLTVHYRELAVTKDPQGRDLVVPVCWSATMKNRDGVFRYVATASTPTAPLIPGGGMLGFEFEGEWTPKEGRAKTLSGTGFCEYGDFAGQLLKLAG